MPTSYKTKLGSEWERSAGGASPPSNLSAIATSAGPSEMPAVTSLPPKRRHTLRYHEPLLLHPNSYRTSEVRLSSSDPGVPLGQELLRWYSKMAETRGMPWRQKWINPDEEEYAATIEGKRKLRGLLERRAYEVWISEIMLQQTRVATVISYWQTWTSRWPTIQDLAAASPEDVLSTWKGLGYYSRATRIHQAAQTIVADPELRGLLPSKAHDLEKKVAGVGRYTAGAISSIVFGRAEAILDGNVSRVLSRQLAFYANPKSKATTDVFWDAAQRLVEGVAGFSKSEENGSSEVPGLWNQALMELGSTVCTPIPKCEACPIRASCRAYAEGERLAIERGLLNIADVVNPQLFPGSDEPPVLDLEDLCERCEPFSALTEQEEQDVAEEHETTEDVNTAVCGKRKKDALLLKTSAKKARSQQSSLLSHFKKEQQVSTLHSSIRQPDVTSHNNSPVVGYPSTLAHPAPSQKAQNLIQSHVKRFPFKVAKSKVREEKCVVCIVELRTGSEGSQYLLEQRPDKGMLASLWEFPTLTLAEVGSHSEEEKSSSAHDAATPYSTQASDFVGSLLKSARAQHLGCLGALVHVFSHLKLEMNVHHFSLNVDDAKMGTGALAGKAKRKWCTAKEIERASVGTGMKRCWELLAVKRSSVTRRNGSPQAEVTKVKRR